MCCVLNVSKTSQSGVPVLFHKYCTRTVVMTSHQKNNICSKIGNVFIFVVFVTYFIPHVSLESNDVNRRSRSIFDIFPKRERTMTINSMNFRFRPFITCWNCTNFAMCLRTCPFKEYPGLDQ